MVEGMGQRLKNSRTRLGLSQEEAGSKVGVKGGTISQFELSSATPSATVLTKLAGLYRVSTDWLCGIEKQETISIEGLSEKDKAFVAQLAERLSMDDDVR